MIDTGDWQLAEAAEEEARRTSRKRNAAFRQRLQQRKHLQRETLKLRLASLAALAAWIFAAVRYWHG